MKQFGCCTVCDVPVFEMGAPLPSAIRHTFVLVDGSQCSLTFCGDCAVTSVNLPEIWRKCIEATVHEATNEFRAAKHTTAQLDYRQQLLCGAGLLKLVDNVPLGLLASQRWTEVLRG